MFGQYIFLPTGKLFGKSNYLSEGVLWWVQGRNTEIYGILISQLRQLCQGKNNASRTDCSYPITGLEWAVLTHVASLGAFFTVLD